MRFINIYTLKLEQFFGDDIPLYAILSHCWEDQELSFEEWQETEINDRNVAHTMQQMQGYLKIIDACRFTKNLTKGWGSRENPPLKYLWIDTVCIDKRSSSELSEAINSMFKWYQDSRICLVYMFDVNLASSRAKITPGTWHASESDALPDTTRQEFEESKWFTRGWTLQELLAPSNTIYLSKTWEVIGTNVTLEADVSAAAKIPASIIRLKLRMKNAPVVEKMSWASRRITTRPEDIAYCLMGIFGVNMPLLYGEGHKAFRRLQLEIIKDTHDHSIFLWRGAGRPSPFAPSPTAFRNACLCRKRSWSSRRDPYTITNLGLQLHLPLLPTIDSNVSLAVLDCKPFEADLIPSLYYCLIVKSPSKHSSKSQNEVQVLGHMVVNTLAFGTEDHGFLKKTLYLDLSIYGFGDGQRIIEMAAAKGKPFMLAYSWYGDPCIITQATFGGDWDLHDHVDAYVDDQLTFELGIRVVKLGLPVLGTDPTSRHSGMELLLFKIFNQKRKKGLWFFVVHHPEYGWTVPWFSDSLPKRGFRKEVMENLPLTMSYKKSKKGFCEHFVNTWFLSSPTSLGRPDQSTCALITMDFGRMESELEGQ